MLLSSSEVNYGYKVSDFSLIEARGSMFRLYDLSTKAIMMAFICNHCPYVKEIMPELLIISNRFKELGMETVFINSNDSKHYPEDGFEHMQSFSDAYAIDGYYLHDEHQVIARRLQAVCTPDIFLLNSDFMLCYRGWTDGDRGLISSIKSVISQGSYAGETVYSKGCSIKWKCT